MKKQDVTFTVLTKWVGIIKNMGGCRVIPLSLLLGSLLFSFHVQAQQTALLDANGVPISDEVLLLLSSASAKVNTIKQKQGTSTNKLKSSFAKNSSNIKQIKRPKRTPNLLLEEEMLNAMKAGQIPRVKQLLRAGVSPTFINYKGETPLGIAVTRGWASMVISLIENGANINEKGARGVTLLHVASSKGLIDVAKVLVKGGLNPSQKTEKNWTPLHIAARFNHWKLVQYFVSAGVDPDIRNSDGQTALGLARHLRHQGIIKILSRVTRRSSLDFAELNLLKKKKKSKKRRKKRKSKK